MKTFKIFVLLILLIGAAQEILAVGALYVRPRFSNQQYEKMWIKTINVNIEMQDQVSVTTVDQTFFNDMSTSVEAIYIFPLPENAMITKLVYWFNGKRYVANIRERQEALNDYNSKLRHWLDPALLEYLGDNLFRLSIVPVDANSEVRTEITYVEMLKYDFGIINYKFLLNTLQLSTKPVETVHLFLDAKSQNTFKYFSSPSHTNPVQTQVTKISDNEYTLEFGDENFFPDKDLVVKFETVRNDVQFNLLTYTPSPQDSMGTDSFYSLWITPPDTVADNEVIPKNIVFTVDVSSSMEGDRLQQVKEALDDFINLLKPGDKFNIVAFGTFVQKFKPDLVEATENNLAEAKNFVFQLYALGLTNINDALVESLQQGFDIQTSNDLIFLTDGEPTWQVTNTDSILAHVSKANTKDVRIFSFGVGESIDQGLLVNLSTQNHGYAQFITSDDSIALVVNNHFTRISKPVMTDISVDLGGLKSWDQYPKILNDLFWGNQVVIYGLYNNSGIFNVTLNGNLKSQPVNYQKSINFTDTTGGHRFIPRLWAKSKINYLLDMIKIYGETKELTDQIIELSLRFQILTPYTAFYSDPTDTDPTDATDIKDKENVPDEFVLKQNYPNPFNPETVIEYSLPHDHSSYKVVVKIFDCLGRLVAVLVDKEQGPGNYKIKWNGKDSAGYNVASGLYILRIQAGQFVQSRKMMLLR